MAATTSFDVDVTNPQGITGFAVVQTQLGRTKVQGSGGPHTLLLYAMGGYIYQQLDGAAWQRRKWPGSGGAVIPPLGISPVVTPEADTRDSGGMSYGAFSAVTTLPIPGVGSIPNVSMECTYDKATLLLHACTSQYATFAFRNYNDPKNVFELPSEAKNATELSPLTGAGLPQGK